MLDSAPSTLWMHSFPIEFFLHPRPAGPQLSHLGRQSNDPSGRVIDANSPCMDIRDQIAVGVGVPHPGAECQVGRETVRRRQSWPFTNEKNHNTFVPYLPSPLRGGAGEEGIQNLAHVI